MIAGRCAGIDGYEIDVKLTVDVGSVIVAVRGRGDALLDTLDGVKHIDGVDRRSYCEGDAHADIEKRIVRLISPRLGLDGVRYTCFPREGLQQFADGLPEQRFPLAEIATYINM